MRNILIVALILGSTNIFAVNKNPINEWTDPETIGTIHYNGVEATPYFIASDELWIEISASQYQAKFVYLDPTLPERAKKEIFAMLLMAKAMGNKVKFRVIEVETPDDGASAWSYFKVKDAVLYD